MIWIFCKEVFILGIIVCIRRLRVFLFWLGVILRFRKVDVFMVSVFEVKVVEEFVGSLFIRFSINVVFKFRMVLVLILIFKVLFGRYINGKVVGVIFMV